MFSKLTKLLGPVMDRVIHLKKKSKKELTSLLASQAKGKKIQVC